MLSLLAGNPYTINYGRVLSNLLLGAFYDYTQGDKDWVAVLSVLIYKGHCNRLGLPRALVWHEGRADCLVWLVLVSLS